MQMQRKKYQKIRKKKTQLKEKGKINFKVKTLKKRR